MIRILILFAVVFYHNHLSAQYFSYDNKESTIDANRTTLDSSNYYKVEYILSRYDEIEKKYINVEQEKIIDPHKSALVLIDIWGKYEFMDSMIINFINPLIKKLSGLGMKIIYAPSQNSQNENLLIIDKGVIIYNTDIMDEYLFYHEIENLFYVGFDTYYCVLDKPNGIYSFKLRDHEKKMNIFLVEEGAVGYSQEIKREAISLMKKNNVGIIKYIEGPYNESFSRKTIEDPNFNMIEEINNGNDFVLIFKNEKLNKSLIEFENELINKNINFGTVIDGKLYYNSQIISSSVEYLDFLKRMEINNLYYSGYYLNNEILWSKFGIIALNIKYKYYQVSGPSYFVINDLSYIIPSEDIKPEIEKIVILNNYWGVGIKNIHSDKFLYGLKIAKRYKFYFFK